MLLGLFVVSWMGLLDMNHYFDDLDTADFLKRFRMLLIVILAPLIPIGVYCIRFGLQVINVGEFPPPGTKVISDTIVKEGAWAVLRGNVLVGLGVCMFLAFVYGAVAIPNVIEGLINEEVHSTQQTKL